MLVLDPGEYDWLNSFVGVALSCMLLAYYRPTPPETRFDARSRAWAFGAVGGLQLASILSWPIQGVTNWAVDWELFGLDEGCGNTSRCLGEVADVPVAIVWVAAAIWLADQHQRRVPYVAPAPPPSP